MARSPNPKMVRKRRYECPLGDFCDEPSFSKTSMFLKGRKRESCWCRLRNTFRKRGGESWDDATAATNDNDSGSSRKLTTGMPSASLRSERDVRGATSHILVAADAMDTAMPRCCLPLHVRRRNISFKSQVAIKRTRRLRSGDDDISWYDDQAHNKCTSIVSERPDGSFPTTFLILVQNQTIFP